MSTGAWLFLGLLAAAIVFAIAALIGLRMFLERQEPRHDDAPGPEPDSSPREPDEQTDDPVDQTVKLLAAGLHGGVENQDRQMRDAYIAERRDEGASDEDIETELARRPIILSI